VDVSSEPQPLEAVYRASWLGLTRLAYLLVGDRSEAEDIVQSVFTAGVTPWESDAVPGSVAVDLAPLLPTGEPASWDAG
jgi:hypothetical protein